MRRVFSCLSSLLIAGMLFSVAGYAQSNPIYFPYVVNDSQTVTDLIFTNVTGQDASLNLTRYPEDGSSPTVSTVAVPASSQVIVGGGTGFKGWAIASSDTPGVLGNLRVASPNHAAQDTTESAQLGTGLILPLAVQSSGATTEIAVANPSPNSARVVLTLYDKDGRIIATTDAGLAGFGMIRGSISALFGVGKNYSAASHVVARFLP